MRKTLAILATVGTLGATAVSAPAEAHRFGPGLAVGLAAGAIAAGAAGAYGYYGPGYGYYGPSDAFTGLVTAIAVTRTGVIAIGITTTGKWKKARNVVPGFFLAEKLVD